MEKQSHPVFREEKQLKLSEQPKGYFALAKFAAKTVNHVMIYNILSSIVRTFLH
jgi:hypothetical protein